MDDGEDGDCFDLGGGEVAVADVAVVAAVGDDGRHPADSVVAAVDCAAGAAGGFAVRCGSSDGDAGRLRCGRSVPKGRGL